MKRLSSRCFWMRNRKMIELFKENEPIEKEEEIEEYGDPGIRSADAPVARWLKITYITLPIWGVIWFYLYCNGSYGWLDRGAWFRLEEAAKTTFPMKNNVPE